MDFIFEISVKNLLRKDSIYIWGKFFVGQCYVKPKSGEKVKLHYMDTDTFIVYIKTDDIYKDIAEDIEIRFDTPNYELDKPLP